MLVSGINSDIYRKMLKRRTQYIIFLQAQRIYMDMTSASLYLLFLEQMERAGRAYSSSSFMNSYQNTDKGNEGGLRRISNVLLNGKRNYSFCLPKSNFCDLNHEIVRGYSVIMTIL